MYQLSHVRPWARSVRVVSFLIVLLLFVGLHAAATAAALPDDLPPWQAPRIIKNIASQTDDVRVDDVTMMGGKMYFLAGGLGMHGYWDELWRTDGTPAGTVRLESYESWTAGPLYALGDQLIFLAEDPEQGLGFWITDGTAGNAHLLLDPIPYWPLLGDLTLSGDYLYFTAYDEEHRDELWRTDGTAAGTIRLTDLTTAITPPQNLVDFNGTLYFYVQESDYTLWLMKSDGTAAGTTVVTQIGNEPVNIDVTPFHAVGGLLYFSFGSALWRTDGTPAGTYAILPNYNPYSVSDMAGDDTILYFIYHDWNNSHDELWISKGTAATTVKLANLPYYYGPFVVRDDRAFFVASDIIHGDELWVSNGTAAGTQMVIDLEPGDNASMIAHMTLAGNWLFFAARGGTDYTGLWRSDGTAAGTQQVPLAPAPDGHPNPKPLSAINGKLVTLAADLPHGREPWITNAEGTSVSFLVDINVNDSLGSMPSSFHYTNNTLFFMADGGLWRSDGSEPGTIILVPYVYDQTVVRQDPEEFGIVGNQFYFLVNDYPSNMVQIWRSNGTPLGTTMVKAIAPMYRPNPAADMTDVGGTMFFSRFNNVGRDELWRSDGTDAGTVHVATPNPGLSQSSEIDQITNAGGIAFFTATDGAHGVELWRSDGTTPGTFMVQDIVAGEAGSNPSELTAFAGQIYFVVDDGAHGVELWRSDGTPGGATLVVDLRPGLESAAPSELTVFNGALYFAADDGVHGRELWRSDGTAAGTVMVKDFPAGGLVPIELTAGLDWLFFVGADEHGYQPWKSDGTAGGTSRIAVLEYNDFDWPKNLVAADNTIFFSTILHTEERFYMSDGTAAGTVFFGEAFPTFYGYNYRHLTPAPGRLFFAADNLAYGAEPFVMPVSLTQHVPGRLFLPEGGISRPYTLALTMRPAANVTLTLTSDEPALQITPNVVSFTPQNWFTPQTITVRAVGDEVEQGTRPTTVDHTFASADPLLNGQVSSMPILVREWRFAYIPSISR